MSIKAFTDGACSGNGKKNAKAGCGVYIPELNCQESFGIEKAKQICGLKTDIHHSNNTGELLAILSVFHFIPDKKCEISIYTDSMYAINSICIWSKNWERNNWKTATGTPVKNKEIIKAIIDRKKEYASVIFIHLNSHIPEPEKDSPLHYRWYGNFKADQLATASISN